METAAGTFHVGGMTKGSGMIEPMMATMLGFLTCDAEVDPALLKKALTAVTRDTFNAITVDGECSTNDTVFAMANGASGVVIDETLYPALEAGLRAVSKELAIAIVRGGEGATKLVRITVTGATEWGHAERAARTIANSLLVKTAIHGGDPNWGRLVAAAGRSGVPFDARRTRRFASAASCCSSTDSPSMPTPRKRRPICRARTSTSRSTWARAGLSRRRSGPAT